MNSGVMFAIVVFSLFTIICFIDCMKKVNDDKWWVEGITKKQRIRECLKDFWFIISRFGTIIVLLLWALLFITT